MLFGLPQALSLLLMGRIPQGQAGSSGVGPGNGGAASQNASGANASGSNRGSGNPGSVSNPSSAPPGAINPSGIYTLDPNNPDGRYTGVQLREGMARAAMYDQVQSAFHRTQNALARERQLREAAEQERDRIIEDQRLQNSLQQFGVLPQGQQRQQQGQPSGQYQRPVQQSLGQQPGGQNAGYGAGDDWLANFAMDDYSSATPGQMPAQGQAQGNGSPNAVYDPREMALMMQALIKEQLEKTLTPIQQQLPQLVDNAVSSRFSQQARQNNVQQSFQAGRDKLADDLYQKWGIDKERSRDILDKWGLASASYEEASRLMSAQYPDPQQQAQANEIANQKLAQGNMFFNAALEDGMTAATEGKEARMREEAQNMLLTGDFVDLGEMQQPNPHLYDPRQIEAQKQMNLSKALEVADMEGRLQAIAGPAGGPVQPGGFMPPNLIQPQGASSTGYFSPLQNTQPVWGNQQAVHPQPQQPPQQGQYAQAPQGQQQVVTPQGQQVNMPQWGAYQQGGVAA